MKSPVATLYTRFSDPDAKPTEWAATRVLLESAQLFWIASVRGDGRPHVTPLVAIWHDDALAFCTGADEQKALNIRDNAHVALTTGRNSWNRGLDVVVEGEARRVSDDAHLEGLAEAWSKKWDGRWQFEVRNGNFVAEPEGHILVFEVQPTRVMAYAKGDFGVTRYQF